MELVNRKKEKKEKKEKEIKPDEDHDLKKAKRLEDDEKRRDAEVKSTWCSSLQLFIIGVGVVFSVVVCVGSYYEDREYKCRLKILPTDSFFYDRYVFVCKRPYDALSYSELPYGTRGVDHCFVGIQKCARYSYTWPGYSICKDVVQEEWADEIREGLKNPVYVGRRRPHIG